MREPSDEKKEPEPPVIRLRLDACGQAASLTGPSVLFFLRLIPSE